MLSEFVPSFGASAVCWQRLLRLQMLSVSIYCALTTPTRSTSPQIAQNPLSYRFHFTSLALSLDLHLNLAGLASFVDKSQPTRNAQTSQTSKMNSGQGGA